MKKLAVVLSEKECYVSTKSPGNVTLKWIIHNQSSAPWGTNCYLKNHCQDDAFVAPIIFKQQLKPNKIKEINLTVYIPAKFKKEKIVLLF